MLGSGALAEEAYAEAGRLLEESVTASWEIRNRESLDYGLAVLGYAPRGLGQLSQAERHFSEALRSSAEVRSFIEREVTPEFIHETLYRESGIYGGPEARKFFKKFAVKGWLVPNWPKKYGGMDEKEIVAYLIRDELSYAGLPCYFTGAHMAGPTILRYGSDEIKDKHLIPIAKGEIEFALGYTEPEAGSDLMNLNMYAEDKGDHFVVNGEKVFNTACHMAEYHWLAETESSMLMENRGPKDNWLQRVTKNAFQWKKKQKQLSLLRVL